MNVIQMSIRYGYLLLLACIKINLKIYSLVIPFSVFWIIFFPLIVFINLRSTKDFQNPTFISKYSFLVDGFRKEMYYW